jgi:hypothetical protein
MLSNKQLDQGSINKLLGHLDKFENAYDTIQMAFDDSKYESIKIDKILNKKKDQIQSACNEMTVKIIG